MGVLNPSPGFLAKEPFTIFLSRQATRSGEDFRPGPLSKRSTLSRRAPHPFSVFCRNPTLPANKRPPRTRAARRGLPQRPRPLAARRRLPELSPAPPSRFSEGHRPPPAPLPAAAAAQPCAQTPPQLAGSSPLPRIPARSPFPRSRVAQGRDGRPPARDAAPVAPPLPSPPLPAARSGGGSRGRPDAA